MFLSLALSILMLKALIIPQSSGQCLAPSCISSYDDLKNALRDNDTTNIRKLLDTFYPPNEATIHSVRVTYCISENKTGCSSMSDTYTYQWATNSFLLIVEPDLLNALTLNLFELISDDLSLVIGLPFCSNDTQTARQLLDTLTTWLRSYANSDTEDDQGYAVFYDPEARDFVYNSHENIRRLRLSIASWLILMIISIMMFLTCRLCSKKIAKRINRTVDKFVDSVAVIASFGQTLRDRLKENKSKNDEKGIEKEMEKNEESLKEMKSEVKAKSAYLTRVATVQNNLSYFVVLLVILVWDIVGYVKANRSSAYNWYLFFPLPVMIPVFFIASLLISMLMTVVKCLKKSCKFSFQEAISITLLTTLSVFVLFHGFWFLLTFGAFPDRIVSKALFLIPLYFPIKLFLQYLSIYVEKFEKFIANLEKDLIEKKEKSTNKQSVLSFEEEEANNGTGQSQAETETPKCKELIQFLFLKMKYAWKVWYEEPGPSSRNFLNEYVFTEENGSNVFFTVFFAIFWIPLLIALYYASDYLLIVTDIRNDPIKLLIFVIATSVLVSRLAKIWKPFDDEESKEDPKKTKNETSRKTERKSRKSSSKSPARKRPPPPPPVSGQLAAVSGGDPATEEGDQKIYESLSLDSVSITEGEYTLAEASNEDYSVATAPEPAGNDYSVASFAPNDSD
ncbi:PREDICTED: uncharacterized protein LOC109581323 [Amphimedon queenslandica]|uniref:Uncharacterized protein n=1 Tax=Amphimedon queenslandica TaxID=400682 RepID=A0A1X7VUZ2_AMPQE|nr:PREDICTED: uncharacterized protein LOC109581323 [Amphimedon queenslandica]|eukprot:XP_019850921.1 PREDICTED: uncharacterized protein LOC109581323 [Amphimedon queenslandica]